MCGGNVQVRHVGDVNEPSVFDCTRCLFVYLVSFRCCVSVCLYRCYTGNCENNTLDDADSSGGGGGGGSGDSIGSCSKTSQLSLCVSNACSRRGALEQVAFGVLDSEQSHLLNLDRVLPQWRNLEHQYMYNVQCTIYVQGSFMLICLWNFPPSCSVSLSIRCVNHTFIQISIVKLIVTPYQWCN